MFGRKYPKIVLSSSIATAVFLLIAEAHFAGLAAELGWRFDSGWVIWAIVPSVVGSVVWVPQQRDWLQLAGVISTAGILVYSGIFVLMAMSTHSLNGHSIVLPSFVHTAVALAWTMLALLIGWFGGRGNTYEQR